jgi:hypothetical protein
VREKWILTLSLEEEEVIMWKGYLLEAINNEDQACKIRNKVRWRKNLNGKNEKEIDILNWMESAACDVWRRSIIKTERMLWFGLVWMVVVTVIKWQRIYTFRKQRVWYAMAVGLVDLWASFFKRIAFIALSTFSCVLQF